MRRVRVLVAVAGIGTGNRLRSAVAPPANDPATPGTGAERARYRWRRLLGIGLDETAALVVRGSVAEVVAADGRRVHFFDRRRAVFPGRPDHASFAHGARFDLALRRELDGEGRALPVAEDLAGTWELRAQTDADRAEPDVVARLEIAADLAGEYRSEGAGARPLLRVRLDRHRVEFEIGGDAGADGATGFDGVLGDAARAGVLRGVLRGANDLPVTGARVAPRRARRD